MSSTWPSPVGNPFSEAHKQSDVDREPSSQHHTLGKGPNNAAPGNHKHDGVYQPVGNYEPRWGTGDVKLTYGAADNVNWFEQGATISRTGVGAALFALFGTSGGPGDGINTFRLPIVDGKFLKIMAPGTTGGSASVVLTEANLPPHPHNMTHDHNIAIKHNNNTTIGGTVLRIVDVDNQTGATGTAATAKTSASSAANTGNGNGTSNPVTIDPPWHGIRMLIHA